MCVCEQHYTKVLRKTDGNPVFNEKFVFELNEAEVRAAFDSKPSEGASAADRTADGGGGGGGSGDEAEAHDEGRASAASASASAAAATAAAAASSTASGLRLRLYDKELVSKEFLGQSIVSLKRLLRA